MCVGVCGVCLWDVGWVCGCVCGACVYVCLWELWGV